MGNFKESLDRIRARAAAQETASQNMMLCLRPILKSGDLQAAWSKACETFPAELPAEIVELFKQYPPVEVCPECGGQLSPEWCGDLLTPWRVLPCGTCRRRDLEAQLDRELPGILSQRGLSQRFAGAYLSDFPKNIINAIPRDRGAFVWGPVGTGKTHLLSAILREAVREHALSMEPGRGLLSCTAGYPLLANLQELLLSVRGCFGASGSATESQIIDDISGPPVLLLDDIGAEKPTEWVVSTIFLVIDRRYRENLRTFFSSNLSLDQIARRLGDRIASRIAGMCAVVHLDGRDRRLNCKTTERRQGAFCPQNIG